MKNFNGMLIKEVKFALGGYADIWKCRLRDGGEEGLVALKVIRGSSQDSISLDAHQRVKYNRELRVWGSLDHANVVSILGTSTEFSDLFGIPSLVMPFYSNGNILCYLKNHPETDKLQLSLQVSAGVNYLHTRNSPIVHGDLRASNVLIDDNGVARLSDFGLSRILGESGFTSTTPRGSMLWKARELLLGDYSPVPTFTVESDIWAFGITVLEIFTGRWPFHWYNMPSSALFAIMNGERPGREHYPEIPFSVWTVLERCWDHDPSRRPRMIVVMNGLTFVDMETHIPNEVP